MDNLQNAKRDVLLTGAGFTHNFGGYLGSDLISETFSHPAVQAMPVLRNLILLEGNPSFEDIYAQVLGDQTQHLPLRKALLDVFERLDAIVRRAEDHHNIYLTNLILFFKNFVGADERRPGFLFTLNQDLFLERHFAREYSAVLPGLCGKAQGREIDHVHSLVPVQIDAQVGLDRVLGAIAGTNIVKLHGSSNWQTPDEKLFVAGRDKKQIIERWPLLASYFDIFKRVLFRKDVRLWVIGYGFLDGHINALLKEAIENYGLRLLVISPEDFLSLRKRMFDARVWHGLAGHFRYRFRDLFPHGGPTVHARAIETLLRQNT